MMYAAGEKRMTPNPIKTKENDEINQCHCVRLWSLGLAKEKKRKRM